MDSLDIQKQSIKKLQSEGDDVKIRNWMLFLIIVSILLLSSCKDKVHDPIAKNRSFVATLNIKENSIDFISEKGKRLTRWYLEQPYIGGFLHGDGDTLVLYGPDLETVDFYSLELGNIKTTFNTGRGITNGVYLPSISKFAFTDKERNEVRFFDLNGEETNSVKTEMYPMDMKAGESFLYVVAFQGTSLAVIDVNQYEVIDEIEIPSSTAGILLREEEGEIWMGGHGKGDEPQSEVYIYSLKEHALQDELSAPLMPVGFYEDDRGIYVLSHGSNMIYRFDQDKKLQKKKEVGANPFAVDAFDDKIVVAGFDSEELYWLHPESLAVEHLVKVGKGPFVIFTREKVK